MLPQKISRGFSFFGLGGGSRGGDTDSKKSGSELLPPFFKLQSDKNVYRPGDPVTITIEIRNPTGVCSLLVERLSFEIKGIEKLDTQWFTTQKLLHDSKQRRGEYVFMDCSAPSIISNQILSSGATKTYVVRTLLPSIIPPSYRGAAIRYLYYVRSTLSGQYLVLENGQSNGGSVRQLAQLEARTPLQIWVSQKTNGLVLEESQHDGIVPLTTVQLNVYWKEMDGDSDWARAHETYDRGEEGYDSSRDEVSSVSSYNPSKETLHKAFGSSFSLQSSAARSSTKDTTPYLEENTRMMSPSIAPPHLSVAEVAYDPSGDILAQQKSAAVISPSQQLKHQKSFSTDDESRVQSVEPVASEDFVRGRSYNIRLDNQVLLRFTPKNSDSTYYFSDMIGGTLTFFHEEQARRCLELSITLEMSETISGRSVHHSRRHSPTITKVHSDHHEVVADLLQTSFLFSIPMDGPMSFSTRHVSVQWSLRFEFFTTPMNVDWTRYEHPLLIEERDKCDWVLPITVHAPPQGTSARNDKSVALEPLWVRT